MAFKCPLRAIDVFDSTKWISTCLCDDLDIKEPTHEFCLV